MSTNPELRTEKIIEMGESAEIVGFEELNRPMLLGLLIFLEEQFMGMPDDVKEKHYEKTTGTISIVINPGGLGCRLHGWPVLPSSAGEHAGAMGRTPDRGRNQRARDFRRVVEKFQRSGTGFVD